MKITHLITDLDVGGAQMMLLRLVRGMDRASFEPTVISVVAGGKLVDDLRAMGVPVHELDIGRGSFDPRAVTRLRKLLKRDPPDVLQTWLYHSDLLGAIAAPGTGTRSVVWGIHMTSLETGSIKSSTIRVARWGARLSERLPDRIICCSESATRVHEELGYSAEKMVTIPNGIDTAEFHPDPTARSLVRDELGVPPGTKVVGLFARFHPQKDHENFLRAAKLIAQRFSEAAFLLAGSQIGSDNPFFAPWIADPALKGRLLLLGERRDMARLMGVCDVVCSSSSFGEAFPLVLGEAMATGVPCVVTDVGDSALIVGDTGVVVPPRDPAALANGVIELLSEPPEAARSRREDARRRVIENFDLNLVVRRYEDVYRQVAGGDR